MSDLVLRPPRESDWPAVLELANRSVAGVHGAGPQDDWLANRRAFDPAAGVQRQWLATNSGGEIVGYLAIESRPGGAATTFRVFVVTEQRATVGERLLDHALAELQALGATAAEFIEYADDTDLVAFLRQHGFMETRRFALDGGAKAVVLSRSLDASQATRITS